MNKNVVYFAVFTLIVLVLGVSIGFNINRQEPEKEVKLNDINEKEVKATFVAIDNNGKGVAGDIITKIKPGNGQVLVNINDVLADLTTQYSARIAAAVAANYTKIDLDNLDVSYNLETEAGVIAGTSAGSVMAVSTIAALLDKELNDTVVITGSIDENGKVVSAGGILQKATAAKEKGAKIFLVPKGSGSSVSEFKRDKECYNYDGGLYCEIKYVGSEESLGIRVGIEIKEVENIGEAVRYFI